MIKTIRKIKVKNMFLIVVLIGAVLILKSPYIDSLYEGDSIIFMKRLLFTQGDNLIANVFWLIPIVGSLFLISNYSYNQLIRFNTRYKNRKVYVEKVLYRTIIYALLFHTFFAILQIIVFSKPYEISLDLNLFQVVLQYVIENSFLSLLVICISIAIKKYIYSYILVLIGIMVLLKVPKAYGRWIPFISLNYTNSINLITVISCIVVTFIIYKLYLHCDIGGNYEN